MNFCLQKSYLVKAQKVLFSITLKLFFIIEFTVRNGDYNIQFVGGVGRVTRCRKLTDLVGISRDERTVPGSVV